MRERPSVADTLIALALALFVLLSRGAAADRAVSWDEPMWVHRAARFLRALQESRWSETLVTGHPGVTTMWAGAASLWWHANVTGGVPEESLEAALAIDEVVVHDADQMRVLGALVPAARRGVVTLHAVLAVLTYGLFRRALGRATALGVTLALLLDPFLLGLSRVLHIDALAAQFMLLAMSALVLYQRDRNLAWLAGSAVATGLAFTTKAYALLLAPSALLFMVMGQHRQDQPIGRVWTRVARDLFLWGAMAWVSVLVIWPAAAQRPLQTLDQVFGLALGYAADPGAATSTFFQGVHTPSPGASFYPVAFLLRTTPLSLIGIGLAIVVLPIGQLWRGDRYQRRLALVLVAYALLYAGLITLSEKKYDRYLLPSMLALNAAAAVVLARLVGVLTSLLRRRSTAPRWCGGALLVGLVSVQALWLLCPLAPADYLAYYNSLAGGMRQAVRTLPVGWGEGLDEALAWLQEQPDAADLTVAAWGVPGIAARFDGEVVTPTEGRLHRADYVLVYIGDVQNEEPVVARFAERSPEAVFELNGQPYAWIYWNDWADEVVALVGEHAGPNALVVSNDVSTVGASAGVALAPHAIEEEDESDIASRLLALSQGHDELWFVCFDAVAAPRTGRIKRQLALGAILRDAMPFAYGMLYRYALPERPAFGLTAADQPLLQDFGPLRLLASGVHHALVEHGQEIGVALSWKTLAPMDADLIVYLHLIDLDGRRWSQRDELLRNEQGETTRVWQEGDDHVSRHTVPLPAGLAPGVYRLQVGLYALGEDEPLIAVSATGSAAHATGVPLGTVTVRPASYPPRPDEVQVDQPMQASLGPLRLLGYRPAELHGRSGERMPLTVCWEVTQDLAAGYELHFGLARQDEVGFVATLALADSFYPSRRWREGEVICRPYDFELPVGFASGVYDLSIDLAGPDGEPLEEAGAVLLGTANVVHIDRRFTAPAVEHPFYYRYGDILALVGLNTRRGDLAPDQPLRLTLFWRVLAETDLDYTVFVHLIDEQGNIISQVDRQPAEGARPTSGWIMGEYLADPYTLDLPAGLLPGLARVMVGLYLPETGQRLPAHDLVQGRVDGDAITLPLEWRIASLGDDGREAR